MSLFTAPKGTGQAPCPRCREPQFVRRVKEAGDFTIMECGRCPDPKTSRPPSTNGAKT